MTQLLNLTFKRFGASRLDTKSSRKSTGSTPGFGVVLINEPGEKFMLDGSWGTCDSSGEELDPFVPHKPMTRTKTQKMRAKAAKKAPQARPRAQPARTRTRKPKGK